MKKQTKSHWQNTAFTFIASMVFAVAFCSQAAAQKVKFNVGDKVECDQTRMGRWEKGTVLPYLDVYDDPAKANYYRFSSDRYPSKYGEVCPMSHMRLLKEETATPTENRAEEKGEQPVKTEAKENQPIAENNNAQGEPLKVGDKIEVEDSNWRANEKWRANYKVGDKVQFTISHKAADFQTCTVTENEPESVMRVKCNAFKHWSADVYIVHSESNFTGEEITEAKPQNKPAKQTGGAGLKLGEYACTGSGGRMMIGLGFKVLSGNRYVDLDGKRSGTYSISGGKITFRGGHLEGVTGRDLKNYWFTVASKASCGPY